MTDDTGWNDFGAYSGGGAGLGHPTPNIDRIAKEGAVFTNWYGQASCTAGRASFITGRIPIRSALSIVVAPGDENRLRKETPTIVPQSCGLAEYGRVTPEWGPSFAKKIIEVGRSKFGLHSAKTIIHALMCESSSEAAAVYRYSSFALQFGVKPYSTPAPSVPPIRLLEPELLSSPGRPPITPSEPQVNPPSVLKFVLAPRTAKPTVA
jgi:hypothetical protein